MVCAKCNTVLLHSFGNTICSTAISSSCVGGTHLLCTRPSRSTKFCPAEFTSSRAAALTLASVGSISCKRLSSTPEMPSDRSTSFIGWRLSLALSNPWRCLSFLLSRLVNFALSVFLLMNSSSAKLLPGTSESSSVITFSPSRCHTTLRLRGSRFLHNERSHPWLPPTVADRPRHTISQ